MNIEEQINRIREELREHNHNYYVLDNPTISDFDFDIKLKDLQDADSPTVRVGGGSLRILRLSHIPLECIP